METPDLKQIELEDGWVIQSTDSYITMNGIKLNHGWWLLHNHGGEQGAVNPRGSITIERGRYRANIWECEKCGKAVPEAVLGFFDMCRWER